MEIQTTNTQLKRQLQSQKHTINHSVVIFIDMSGYQQLNHILGDENCILIIEALFRQLDTLVSALSLKPVKTNGDQYIVISETDKQIVKEAKQHSPTSIEISTMHALHFATSAHNIVQTNKTLRKHNCGLRIGIASGPVIAGYPNRHMGGYDIWGLTVNLAAMLEQSTPKNTTAVCAKTLLCLPAYWKSRFRQTQFLVKNRRINAFVTQMDKSLSH